MGQLSSLKTLVDALQQSGEAQGLDAINKEIENRWGSLLTGLGAYANRSESSYKTPYDVIWSKGNARLLALMPRKHDAVILMVPSLINRWNILDLHQDCSMARFLLHHGFNVQVLDWGEPGELEKSLNVRSYIEEILIPAIEHAGKTAPVYLLGYCMGGTMAVAAAQLLDKAIAGLVLLAAPWDFAVEPFAAHRKTLASAASALKDHGTFSSNIVQAMFHLNDPFLFQRKFQRLGRGEITGFERELFMLVEEWVNDGVNLSAPAAKECLNQWIGGNTLQNGAWAVGGRIIQPGLIKVPTLAVIPVKDKIVPPPSAFALADNIPLCTTLTPDCGHIGITASLSAAKLCWQPMLEWIRDGSIPGK